MNDLANRILDCVPAGTFGLGAFFRLVDLAVTTEVPTAAVTGGVQPRLLVNPEFVDRHARTPERLLMLVMHELQHIVLGHTRILPVATALDNIAFDAVINAILCRNFPDPRGIAFFTDLYRADRVPEALLRPAPGWQPSGPRVVSQPLLAAGHRRLADLHAALYSPAGVSYDELRSGIAKAFGKDGGEGPRLLGSHGDDARNRGDLAERAPVLVDVLRRIVEGWPPGLHVHGRSTTGASSPLVVRPGRSSAATRVRLRELLTWAAGRTEGGTVRQPGPGNAIAQSPLPSRSRRDLVLALAGSPVLLHEHEAEVPRFVRRGERVHVYFDVSGSMQEYVAPLAAALRDCAAFVHPVVHAFSTEIDEVPFARLRMGRFSSTGGTEIACVAEHARRHGVRRAVVVTDGWVGRAGVTDAETLRGIRLGVAYVGGGGHDDLAEFAGRRTTLEPAA